MSLKFPIFPLILAPFSNSRFQDFFVFFAHFAEFLKMRNFNFRCFWWKGSTLNCKNTGIFKYENELNLVKSCPLGPTSCNSKSKISIWWQLKAMCIQNCKKVEKSYFSFFLNQCKVGFIKTHVTWICDVFHHFHLTTELWGDHEKTCKS